MQPNDAPTQERPSADDLAKRIFTSYGKLQSLEHCPIKLSGKGGTYTLVIDGGKAATLSTAPVFGGDGKRPVMLSNVFGDPYDSLWQAKTINAAFNRAGHQFTLKGTNAYFIADLKIDKPFEGFVARDDWLHRRALSKESTRSRFGCFIKAIPPLAWGVFRPRRPSDLNWQAGACNHSVHPISCTSV